MLDSIISWFEALSGWEWAILVCCVVVGIIALWLVCHRVAMAGRSKGSNGRTGGRSGYSGRKRR